VIPRYQRILFWVLSVSILLMAAFFLHGCEQAREKLTRHRDETPLAAPVGTASQTAHLAFANDADGSITVADREIPLPTEATARARTLLTRLIAEYSYKNSTHPLESGPAIDDVFLLNLPLQPPVAPGPKPAATNPETPSAREVAATPTVDALISEPHVAGGQLAVVNLHGTFADHHPSGIEVETLTIQSIVGTLYANFPRIQEVRFLVDGRPRETLNGHADLARTYSAVNTATKADTKEPR
jgi:Sporulation and spore germination